MSNQWILGVHLGHDASAAILKDGAVVAAIEEERLTRIKGFAGFPYHAIEGVLRIAGVTAADVGTVAIAGKQLHKELPYWILLKRLKRLKPWRELYSKGLIIMSHLLNSDAVRRMLYEDGKFWENVHQELRRIGFDNAEFRNFDHHECHASSAYFPSPFSDAMVFTLDAKGDFCSGSISSGEKGQLRTISRVSHLDSIGQFYAAITKFLGFRPNRHEGKITGLAAFGNAEPLASNFRNLISFQNSEEPAKEFRRVLPGMADPREATTLADLDRRKVPLRRRIEIGSNEPDNIPYVAAFECLNEWIGQSSDGCSKEDIAAAAQTVTEDWIVHWVKQNLPSGETDVCLAGGVFANVKVNQRIREIDGVRNIYVQPAMGDDGLSLGAALLALKEGQSNVPLSECGNLRHVYLGPCYSDEQIKAALEEAGEDIEWERVDDVETRIARLIHNGGIVGRFNGAMEWGPRALGNRSILVRPTDNSINDALNVRLHRTEFMPFAPSVLDYRAKDYFIDYDDSHIAADFMTVTYDVYPERQEEIEAVVHVDGTARPQVIHQDTNPSFHKILREYEILSGLGLLVNTSFNIHEEPIVSSPEDALRALRDGAVDVLAIGSFLVRLNG